MSQAKEWQKILTWTEKVLNYCSDLPGEGVIKNQCVFSRVSDLQFPLDCLFVGITASQWDQNLHRAKNIMSHYFCEHIYSNRRQFFQFITRGRQLHVPFIYQPVPPHLGLLQWCLCTLPVDRTEGNALRFRGKCPQNTGSRAAHADGDDAVAAGLDEQFSGAVPKPWDVIYCEVDREPTAQKAKKNGM